MNANNHIRTNIFGLEVPTTTTTTTTTNEERLARRRARYAARKEAAAEAAREAEVNRKAAIRATRYELRKAGREIAQAEGLHGAAMMSRGRKLYRALLEATRSEWTAVHA